jgi:hypothetical protein
MNNLAVLYHLFSGLLFISAFLFVTGPGCTEKMNWIIWACLSLPYGLASILLFNFLQRLLFGQKYVIDINKYVIPEKCPVCHRKADQERVMRFDANGGVASVSYPFPIKLCQIHAEIFDQSWLKKVSGVRVSRVVRERYTIYLKSFEYSSEFESANKDSNAILMKK